MASDRKSILIVGLKHCGKSSIGRELAKQLSIDFYDMDDVLESIYKKENGNSLSAREIYKIGRGVFWEYETKAVRYLLIKAKEKTILVAGGGGICDNSIAIELLANMFNLIYIEEEVDVLYNRIIKNGIPAFLPKKNTYEAFRKIYTTRSEKNNNIANIKITAMGLPLDIIINKTKNILLEEGYAGK